MQKPKCKLCGQAHWVYEPHGLVTITGAATQEPVTKLVTKSSSGDINVTPIAGNIVTRGRPRLHETNAARQAAYRGRHAE